MNETLTKEQRAKRNKAIAAEYRKGALQRELAAKYGIDVALVCRIIAKQGARLTQEEKRKRFRENSAKSGGRPRLYSDDPAARAHYEAIRVSFPPARVREIMRARFPQIRHPQ